MKISYIIAAVVLFLVVLGIYVQSDVGDVVTTTPIEKPVPAATTSLEPTASELAAPIPQVMETAKPVALPKAAASSVSTSPDAVADEFNEMAASIDSLFSRFDTETLSAQDCEVLGIEMQQVIQASDYFRASGNQFCSDCEELATYNGYQDEELYNLVDAGDWGAMHALGNKLLAAPETVYQGIDMLEQAIVRGSKPAIESIYLHFENKLSRQREDGLSDEQIKDYTAKRDAYFELMQYRDGRHQSQQPSNATDQNNGKGFFYQVLDRLEMQRQEQFLPEFVNKSWPTPPPEFGAKCTQLKFEYRQQQAALGAG